MRRAGPAVHAGHARRRRCRAGAVSLHPAGRIEHTRVTNPTGLVGRCGSLRDAGADLAAQHLAPAVDRLRRDRRTRDQVARARRGDDRAALGHAARRRGPRARRARDRNASQHVARAGGAGRSTIAASTTLRRTGPRRSSPISISTRRRRRSIGTRYSSSSRDAASPAGSSCGRRGATACSRATSFEHVMALLPARESASRRCRYGARARSGARR